MAKTPFTDPAGDIRRAHEAERRAQALADELADATLERRRLQEALAAAEARAYGAEQDAEAARRRLAAARGRQTGAQIREDERARVAREYARAGSISPRRARPA